MKCLTKNKGDHKAVIFELEAILLSTVYYVEQYCDKSHGKMYIEISPQVTQRGSLKLPCHPWKDF